VEKRKKENNMENINRKKVIENDNDIKRQIPGILTEKDKKEIPNQLKKQELFYRSINR
jgi:hypothetical protein